MQIEAFSKLAGAEGVKAALKRASEATGAGFDVLYNMARRESSLDPSAKAATSSAAGLFQFIEQTWLGAVKAYGARHGLAAEAASIAKSPSGGFTVADVDKRAAILDLRFDPQKAAALAGELIEENRAGLERCLGRAAGAAEIYAAHFLGLNGAVKLLAAPPDAIAADLAPRAAAANRAVFYDGARAKTVREVIAGMAKSMGAGPAKAETPSLAETTVKAAAIEAPEKKSALGPAPLRPPHASPLLSGPLLSPMALAALQALDPTLLGRRETSDR